MVKFIQSALFDINANHHLCFDHFNDEQSSYQQSKMLSATHDSHRARCCLQLTIHTTRDSHNHHQDATIAADTSGIVLDPSKDATTTIQHLSDAAQYTNR
jgi:hypothetical protein